MRISYKRSILVGSTVVLLVLNILYFPYGTVWHDLLVHGFFLVIIMTAFWDLRILFPIVLFYVISHSVHDGYIHGQVPMVTWIQSAIHFLTAGVLYRVLILRNKAYDDKQSLIEALDLGHAHFKGLMDEEGQVRDVLFLSLNRAFSDMFQLDERSFEDHLLLSSFEDMPDEWFQMFMDVIRDGESNETTLYVPSLEKHFRLTFYVPKTKEGAVLVRDITVYKKRTEQIHYLNRHDHLTGFYNRDHLMNVIQSYANEKKGALGAILLDIDNLQLLNRVYGASGGDQAIKLAARALEAHAHEDHMLFRYGGDEFVLLSKNPEEQTLGKLAREIELDFSSKAVNEFSMTMTSGIAVKSQMEGDMEMLLVEAENALYNRKAVKMNSSHIQMLKGLLELLTAKYSYEKVHSERVSRLSQELSEAVGLSGQEIEETRVAAMFHDIGKIAIPDAILGKPSKLTKDEYEKIKEHSKIGHMILRTTAPNISIADYVLYHHERVDGKGYPEGLSRDEIPMISRIISVVDAYEAMTSNREYSPPMSKQEAIEEIIANKGTQFDSDIAETFINHVLKKEEG